MNETVTQKPDVSSLATEWERTTCELKEVISSFSEENFNVIPFDGSWSAAQLCDHLSKSLTGLLENIFQNNEPVDRAPDLYVEQLKKIILNFNVKYNAPRQVNPDTKSFNKKMESERLKDLSAQVFSAIEILDLSKLCTLYPFPGIGNLTRLEWINFNLYHIQRHIRQLRNIRDHLK